MIKMTAKLKRTNSQSLLTGSSEGLSCMVCTGAAEYCPNDDEGVSKPCTSGIYNCYKAVSTGSTGKVWVVCIDAQVVSK